MLIQSVMMPKSGSGWLDAWSEGAGADRCQRVRAAVNAQQEDVAFFAPHRQLADLIQRRRDYLRAHAIRVHVDGVQLTA